MDAPSTILDRFKGLHPTAVDLSLGRMNRLMTAVGNPEVRLPPTIHVAGTNGKGSTIAFLRAILEAAGKRVHVYTSPHLVDLRERIRLATPVGGALVSETDLSDALLKCEAANAGQAITVFEALTAAAFMLFASTPADVLLLEVGLGGRLDATNIIPTAAASIITPVSFDHTEYLGSTLNEIASEKSGIIRKRCSVIVSAQIEAVQNVIAKAARCLSAPIDVLGDDFSIMKSSDALIYSDWAGSLTLPLPALVGDHQAINAATAIAAIRRVFPETSSDAVSLGLLKADWPARLERVSKGRLAEIAPPDSEIWLDGAHNEDGAKVLATEIRRINEAAPRPTIIFYGSLRSKDPHAFLGTLSSVAHELVAVPLDSDQLFYSTEQIAHIASTYGLTAHLAENLREAFRFVAERTWIKPPRIVITGSLYLVGAACFMNGNEIR